jgi:hypothetical protein
MAPQVVPDPALGASAAESSGAPSRVRDGGDTVKSTRAAWLFFFALLAVSMLVFWAFDALPFQDLPAHAGLIAMRHRFAESEFEQRFFVLAPHIGPYSLFRFLGECFVRVMSPVAAVRAIASLPVIATPLALSFARRRLYGDRSAAIAYVGLTLSFGLMTLLGFASYLLGVSVMLVGATLWLSLAAAVGSGERDTSAARKKEIAVALFSPLVFVAHGHAFLLYLLVCAISCFASTNRRAVIVSLRALVPAVALAAWVAWMERGGTRPAGSAAVAAQNLVPHFQGLKDKASLLLTPTLMTRTGVDLVVGVALWAFAVSAVVSSVRRARALPASATTPAAFYSRTLRWSALVLFVVFAALPHSIGWFGFVDGRLLPIILYLALLSVDNDALSRVQRVVLTRGAPIGAAAVVAMALVASYRFQDEARGYHEVLAHVPERARLLNLPLDPNSDVFTAHPFVHYDKLVLADRPIVVSDVWFHQGSALYPTRENPALRLPASYSESDLKLIEWNGYDLTDWDYILVRTRPDGADPRGSDAPKELVLVEHHGGWWLYTTHAFH